MIAWFTGSPALAGPTEAEEKGRWDAEVALDVLHATSSSEAPDAGPTPGLSATELGMRIRGTVETGDILAAVDYHGREAVAGAFPTTTWRLFYRAELVGTVANDHLDLAAGRFVAPSVLFVAVDGARVAWRPSDTTTFQLFGGRRGVSSARQTVDFGTFLPAVGATGGVRGGRGAIDGLVSFAGDQLLVNGLDPELAETIDTWTSLAGSVRGHVEPKDDTVLVGGAVTANQRASYVFLPNPGAATVTAQAFDLYQGLAYLRWRASDSVRVDVDVIRQTADVTYLGAQEGVSATDIGLIDPRFTDLRGRAAFEPTDAVWIRPDVRLRLREGRSELRYGVGADAADLFVDGPIVRGRFWLEDIGQGGAGDDVGAIDRVYWSASGGWSRGNVDAEVGASRVDRAAGPVSARTSDASASDDLNPFVLEAQDIAFARLFLVDRPRFGGWFAGLDGEMNLTDAPEFRAFVQVGVLGDGSW